MKWTLQSHWTNISFIWVLMLNLGPQRLERGCDAGERSSVGTMELSSAQTKKEGQKVEGRSRNISHHGDSCE